MQVGDAFVAIHHRERRACGERCTNIGGHGIALVRGQVGEASLEVAEAVIRIEADALERRAVFGEHGRDECTDGMPEEDRVADLHHRGFEVQREQHAFALRCGDGALVEGAQLRDVHHGRVDDLAGFHREVLFQHRDAALFVDELDAQAIRPGERRRALAPVEIAALHRRDVSLGIRAPRADAMRVFASVRLDRCRAATIRVAFAQHGIDGAAEHLGITRRNVPLFGARRIRRIFRHGEPVALQLSDRRGELRQGSADVRQLDDVGVRLFAELAELREVIGERFHSARQSIGKGREDAPGEGDVAQLDRYTRRPRECLHDR